jgi:zinc protease
LNYRSRLKWNLAFLIFFLYCLSIPLSEAGLRDQVFETVLPNGLKVIFLENHKAPLVTFQVWYRVGSRNEAWGKTGLSHMLEHMMFKGTEKTGPEEFSRIIQENGGNLNAFTSYDYTAYFENLSTDRIRVAIDLEADRMQNLVLREEDFRTERMVVMEERRMRTETYYRTYYNPVNAILVIVGDFKKEELLPKIEKAFGSYLKGVAPNQDRDKDPPQIGERRIFVKKEAQLPFLVMGYHVPNLREQDSYVLEVIATLLSGGKSSRLYQSLVREKRLVLSAEADQSLISRDPSLFTLSADLLPGKEVAEVEKAFDQEIERLQKELVGKQELEKVMNQIEASFIFGQDSLFYQAMLLARHEIALSWRAIDNYLPSIKKVTPEDIQRVAKKYLIPDNRTVGILIPLPPKEGKPASAGRSINDHVVR